MTAISRTIAGKVSKIRYRNEKNGNFSVFDLVTETGAVVRVVANDNYVFEGQSVQIQGEIVHHPKYGPQIKAKAILGRIEITGEGLVGFLSSQFCKKVGRVFANRLVKSLGVEKTLAALNDGDVKALQEAPGIGPKRAAAILKAWEENGDIREVMAFLKAHAIPDGLAYRIYQNLGAGAAAALKQNPYLLTRIDRIGFATADRIAREMGIAADSAFRIEAAILETVRAAAENEGHVWLPYEEIVDRAGRLTGIEDPDRILAVLKDVATKDDDDTAPVIETDDGKGAGLAWLVRMQQSLAEKLARLAAADAPPVKAPPRRIGDLTLTEEQHRAITLLARSPVAILTGGPGVGKTTTVRAFVDACRKSGLVVALAAPTGKAARRLAESCRLQAHTVHRLLGVTRNGKFIHDAENPLPADAVIVDESSMLDVPLACRLANALRPGTRLVLVGDENQLPSVGAGNVFRDLIASGRVPVAKLSTVHRQAADSPIIRASWRINDGQVPRHRLCADGGFAVLYAQDRGESSRQAMQERMQRWILGLIQEKIPQRFGIGPADIQVLSPIRRGALGVEALNRLIQEALNPDGTAVRFGDARYRIGDPVVQIRNDYQNQVFNGDQGRIVDADPERSALVVSFDKTRQVRYAGAEIRRLQLAYAMTIHKSQGSEFEAVILPVDKSQYILLDRNLLYTAVTRGRRLVVLIAESGQVLHMAVNRHDTRKRHTGLDRLLNLAAERRLSRRAGLAHKAKPLAREANPLGREAKPVGGKRIAKALGAIEKQGIEENQMSLCI